MLFSSKNSHFSFLTPCRSDPRDPGDSDAHETVAILCVPLEVRMLFTLGDMTGMRF